MWYYKFIIVTQMPYHTILGPAERLICSKILALPLVQDEISIEWVTVTLLQFESDVLKRRTMKQKFY